MSYSTDDNGVIENFMKQKDAKSRTLRTDGQSLWSFDTRIAEHIPDGNGQGATIVYDYTYGGGNYDAQKFGLCPLVETRNDSPRSTR